MRATIPRGNTCELAAGVGKGAGRCCLVLSMMLVFMIGPFELKDIITVGFPGVSCRSPKIGPVFGTKTEASFLVPTMDTTSGPPKKG